ncbi:MAG: hypothetical protein ACRDHC_01115, partial [Actinomycetota bacterium]
GGATGATGDGDGDRGEVVGEISAVTNPAGFVDDRQVSTGDDIRARAFVSTDGGGRLDYVVQDLLSLCKLLGSSEVRVRPEEGVVLSLVAGETLCSKDADSALEITLEAPGLELRMNDPVFAMLLVDGGSMVKVAEGFVAIEPSGGGDSLLLGPAQQSFVPTSGSPQAPGAMQLDDEELAAMNELLGQVPPPDKSPPDPAASPTMARIRERDQIEVVTDEAALTDEVDAFASTLLLDLSSSDAWDLAPPDVFPVDRDTAIQAVTSGEADAFLTPDPPDGFSSVLTFADPTGRLWYLSFVPDSAFEEALTRFVRAVLNDGTYADRYVTFFDVQPSYEQLGSLVGF